MATVDVLGLAKQLGGRQLIADLSFTFEGPVMVAVMGPSGSGKSTLLAMLGGLVPPDRGRLHLAGREGPARIGWIHQTAPALPQRTVLDNVLLGHRILEPRGSDAGAARAREHLAALGMDHLATTKVKRLSGGERQRVAVARAMTAEADVILADEPTASLDRVNRTLVCESLREATTPGRVVVIATHDSYVADACDTVIDLGNAALRPAEGA